MRDLRFLSNHARSGRAALVLVITGFATGALACTSDTTNPTQPVAQVVETAGASTPVIVNTSADLVAALVPANTGRHIQVNAGNYSLTQPLTVPDGATLEGKGVMLFDAAKLPVGFATGTRTTIIMTANTPGDVLTLGNDATVRGIAIEDLAGRIGNGIGIVSRGVDDRISATVEEVEIINPNTHAISPTGPSGCGIVVFTANPNLGGDPPPHSNAAVASRLSRSIIRSGATGTACAVFAFNFAPSASASVAMNDNILGGGIIANGGVSRPDAVIDSRTEVTSRHNLYRNDSPDLCAPQRLGWNALGGSGTPAPLPVGETRNNTLSIDSNDDRIEGFTTAVSASGGRRFFAAPTAGPTSGNTVDLKIIGATIRTPSCGGAAFVADFRLAGAITAGTSLIPGDGNTVRALIRGVEGSGSRANVYANVLGSSGPVASQFEGNGNLLEMTGNLQAFMKTNKAIDPAPGSEFFVSDR